MGVTAGDTASAAVARLHEAVTERSPDADTIERGPRAATVE
jgi:hypothetical protein